MTIPDNFLMILDLDMGTLAFMADGHYLGVAHSGLRASPAAPLYPIVSAVWGHCEVSLRYRDSWLQQLLILKHHVGNSIGSAWSPVPM